MNGSSETSGGALRLYFDVLACVVRADQEVHPDERSLLMAAAAACDLGAPALAALEEKLDLAKPLDVDGILASAASSSDPSLLTELVRDAYVIAGADRDTAPVEIELIERFLEHAGYDEAGRAVLLEWGRRAAEHHMDGVQLAAELRRA